MMKMVMMVMLTVIKIGEMMKMITTKLIAMMMMIFKDQHREGKNVNILEELYNLLISWKSGSESNRMEMDQTITVRTAWTAFNPSKG